MQPSASKTDPSPGGQAGPAPSTAVIGRVAKQLHREALSEREFSNLQARNRRLLAGGAPSIVPYEKLVMDADNILLERDLVEGIPFTEMDLAGDVLRGLELATDLFQSLADLHEIGFLNRNLHPSNIILKPTGDIRLVDGLVNVLDISPKDSVRHETAVCQLEKLHCFAPEQLGLIDAPLQASTDLYSAGVVLYKLFTGVFPVAAERANDLFLKLVAGAIEPATRIAPGLPDCLCCLLDKLLRVQPAERYQTAAAAVHDLQIMVRAVKQDRDCLPIPLGTTDIRRQLTRPGLPGFQAEFQTILNEIKATLGGKAGVIRIDSESDNHAEFLDECQRIARHRNLLVLRGSPQQEQGSIFPVLETIADQLVEAHEKAAWDLAGIPAEQRQVLVQSFPILGRLFQKRQPPDPSDEREATVPEAFGERRILNAFCGMLERISREVPTVVLLNDLHLAEKAIQKFIVVWNKLRHGQAAGEKHLLLMAASGRVENRSSSPLSRLDCTTHLQLKRLSRSQCIQYASSMAGKLPREALRIIVRSSAGSPFMITALLRGMVESGALAPQPPERSTDLLRELPQPARSGWQIDLSQMADLQSSAKAASILSNRISRLSDDLVGVLTAAAAIGKTFVLEHLQGDWCGFVSGLSPEKLQALLDEAVAKQLIWLDGERKTGTFIHEKIQAAVLGMLDADQLKGCHRHYAEFLEETFPDDAARIALHFDAAGCSDLAFLHAMQAATDMRRRYSLEEAARFYQIADRGMTSPDSKTDSKTDSESDSESDAIPFRNQFDAAQTSRFTIQMGLGDVRMLLGQYDLAEQHYEKALLLANSPDEKARLTLQLGELAFKRGQMEDALDFHVLALKMIGLKTPRNRILAVLACSWQIAIQLLHTLLPQLLVGRRQRIPSPSEDLKIIALSRIGHVYWFADSQPHCLWSHLSSMNLAEQFQPTLSLARTYSDHAPAMSLIPLVNRGLKYAERSKAIRKQLGDTWGEGQSLHYQGIVLFAAGRFREAIATCQQAIELLERMGDYWEVHIARYQIAAAYYYLGDFDNAVAEAKKIHESGLETGDFQASAISLDVWARADIGHPAFEVFDRELVRNRKDSQGAAQLMLGHGVRQLAHGEFAEAAETFRRGLQEGSKSGIHNIYVIPNYAWRVTALRLQAERTPSYRQFDRQRLINQARRVVRKGRFVSWPFRHLRPHFFRELGLLAAMQGKRSRARRFFRRSIAAARSIGAEFELTLTKVAIGRLEEPRRQSPARGSSYCRLILDGEKPTRWLGDHRPSVSLADRFSQVMSCGRNVIAALGQEAISAQVCQAALRLIRGQKAELIPVESVGGQLRAGLNEAPRWVQSEAELIHQALQGNRAVATASESPTQELNPGSAIAVPIQVRRKTRACLLVRHDELSGLYDQTELQLADYIATIAGASLENAEAYEHLRELNATLENRVEQRTAELNSRAAELAESNLELITTARDLRLAQSQLERAIDKAEAANQAKSDFLATMSHEIRTPMNAVIGMTQMCLDTELDQVQRGYLKVVKQSARSLLRILNDILDFSKIEAGKLDIEKVSLNVPSLVEDSCQLMSINAFDKGLDILIDLDPEIPANLLGDPGRLQQILINLIGNAVKFTDSGHIEVGAKLVNRLERQVELCFSVSDTGIGIPEEKQQHIFGSFSQADSSTTRKFGGTGLGLSICSRLVEMMGGRIWVESELGQGSTFRFTVILECDPNVAPPTDNALQGKSLLIVSSDSRVIRSIDSLARVCGVDTIEHHDVLTDDLSWHRDLLVICLSEETDSDGIATIEKLATQSRPIVLIVPEDRRDVNQLANRYSNIRLIAKPATSAKLQHAGSNLFGTKKIGPPTEQPSDGEGQSSCGQPLRILLAEDVPVNQQIATHCLQRMGHLVTVAENGLAALQAMESEEFDCVFMDVEMPVMDGLEATRRIRSTEGLAGLPVIAMTAHVVPDIRRQCDEVGMTDYISKPFEIQQIQAVLRNLAPASHDPAACE